MLNLSFLNIRVLNIPGMIIFKFKIELTERFKKNKTTYHNAHIAMWRIGEICCDGLQSY